MSTPSSSSSGPSPGPSSDPTASSSSGSAPNPSNWWGRFTVPAGNRQGWQVGSLHFWVENHPKEWRILWQPAHLPPGSHPEEQRFVFRSPKTEIVLQPTLADRSVVSKLEKPLHLLPGEQTMIYISTPLWVRFQTVAGQDMMDVPTLRLSDTWFGPVAGEGEICYASKVPAVLRLEDVQYSPHAALTAVLVKNRGEDILPIERLNLPMPRLSLFYSSRSGFWTDRLTIEHRGLTDLADVELERQPPPETAPTEPIAPPRVGHSSEHNVVFRAFNTLFRDRAHS